MDISNFKQINKEISNALLNIKYDGDLGDIGNEIGIIIFKYFNEKETGSDLKSFMDGLEHGMKLSEKMKNK